MELGAATSGYVWRFASTTVFFARRPEQRFSFYSDKSMQIVCLARWVERVSGIPLNSYCAQIIFFVFRSECHTSRVFRPPPMDTGKSPYGSMDEHGQMLR